MTFWKRFTPVDSDAPRLLREAAQAMQTVVYPLAAEILVPELNPLPSHFEAPRKLADALHERAAVIEAAISDYNAHRGKASVYFRKRAIAVSGTIEDALMDCAEMSRKLKVPFGDEGFRQVAEAQIGRAWDLFKAAQDSAIAAERQLFATNRGKER